MSCISAILLNRISAVLCCGAVLMGLTSMSTAQEDIYDSSHQLIVELNESDKTLPPWRQGKNLALDLRLEVSLSQLTEG